MAILAPLAAGFQLVTPPRPVTRAAAALRSGRPVLDEADAAVAEESKIITFSERALAQLEGMRAKSDDGKLILRMGGAHPSHRRPHPWFFFARADLFLPVCAVRAGGCSGMSYVMDLEKPENVDENDTKVELDENMNCVIDPKSLMFLYGMKLDYSDEVCPRVVAGGPRRTGPPHWNLNAACFRPSLPGARTAHRRRLPVLQPQRGGVVRLRQELWHLSPWRA